MNKENKPITIIGAGPVGSLLSIYLCRQGYDVSIYEKRPDVRLTHKAEGRSINIALSHRGLRALSEAGIQHITSIAVPMKGRMIHGEQKTPFLQPYGEEDQMIFSVSRNELNEILLDEAEKNGVHIYFNTQCESVDIESGIAVFKKDGHKKIKTEPSLIFGADGAFSVTRNSLRKTSDFTFNQSFLSHGYKELHIPASESKHVMEKNALHIWPREQFMFIALPNTDGSFTATLFLPFKGKYSFETLKTTADVESFFEKFFPDVIKNIADLKETFFAIPPSYLVTVQCFPWIYKDKICLIGDAAHAITPFYGQGMNAGFEDCRVLNDIINEYSDNWDVVLNKFMEERKENADAIAELALQNFIEMRDRVGDENFILQKKIEAKIHEKDPSYLPLYSMVTFSDMSYKEALGKGKEHEKLMQEVMRIKNIKNKWNTEEGWTEIEKIIKKTKELELPAL